MNRDIIRKKVEANLQLNRSTILSLRQELGEETFNELLSLLPIKLQKALQ